MRNWLKTVLLLSAFAPVLLPLAWVKYSLHGPSSEVWQLVLIGSIGAGLPYLILVAAHRHGENLRFQAKKVESNDFMMFVFIAAYFVPLVAKASSMDFSATLMLVAIIGIILWFVPSIPTHPILQLGKFRFYKVESSSGVVYTLIARREILDPRSVNSVTKLSMSMLLEV